jgi:hypothetical protein
MTTEKQGEIIEKIITPKKGRPSKVVQPVTIENVEVKEQARTIEFVTKPKSRDEALQYRVYVKGIEYWYTKLQIKVGLERGFDIKIPEGSPIDAPLETRCTNCG